VNKTQAAVARMVVTAVYKTIAEIGTGAPRGIIYAAMEERGCSKAQYDAIETSMLGVGLITMKHDMLFAVPEMARELGIIT